MAWYGQILQREGKFSIFCNSVSHNQWEHISQGHVALGTDGVSGGRVEHGYLNFLSHDSQATLFGSPWRSKHTSSLSLFGNKGMKYQAVGPGAGDSPGGIYSIRVAFPGCN